MNKNDPAFPNSKKITETFGSIAHESHRIVGGISKLDYFAAKAMEGWISKWGIEFEGKTVPALYKVAEMMLAESEKRAKGD